MKKHLLYIIAGLLCSLPLAEAQSQIKSLSVQKDFFKGSAGIKSIRLNATSVAFLTNKDDKTVEISGTDNDAHKKWTATVDGYLQETVLLGKNLVVLVSTDFTFFTRANSIYKAFLIDAEKGTILKEKILFTGNNDYFTFPYLIVSKDKKTLTLAARETAMKRNAKIGLGFVGGLYIMKKMSVEGNKVQDFKVLTFDENLTEKSAISPKLPEGEFIGIQKTMNEDLYIAVSENKKGITISKYLPNSEKSIKTVTEPYVFYSGLLGMNHLNGAITLHTDTLNNNTVYLSGSFKLDDDYITMFNKYDFDGDQHKRFKKSITKKDLKGLEKSYIPFDKEFKKIEFAPASTLELVKLVMYDKGYHIILTDNQHFSSANSSVRISQGIIVYNLTSNLEIQSISAIPRDYKGSRISSINVYQQGNDLNLLASHDDHANLVAARININSGKLAGLQRIKPNKANTRDYADLSNALFNERNFIIPVLENKGLFEKIKNDIQLYQFSW